MLVQNLKEISRKKDQEIIDLQKKLKILSLKTFPVLPDQQRPTRGGRAPQDRYLKGAQGPETRKRAS